MPDVFQRRVYDSPAVGRMSDLIRTRGAIAANTALQQGDASARMWGSLGQTIAGTMQDLVQAKAVSDENARRQRQEDRIDADRRKEDNLQGVLRMVADLPVEDATKTLRREGYADAADKLEAAHTAKVRDGITLARAQREEALAQIGQALNLVSTVASAPAPDQPQLWQTTAPQIRSLVGEELARSVPDAFDPSFLNTALEWGMTTEQKLERQIRALSGITDPAKVKNAEERLQLWLSTADTPEEWDGALQTAAAVFKVPKDVLVEYGPFTPENVARVQQMAGKKGDTSPGSTEQQHLTRYAKGLGKTVEALTAAEMRAARASWTAAGREPDRPGSPTGASQAQKAAAERWKQGQLATAEARFSDGLITEPQLAQEKARIQASYEEQLGVSPSQRTVPGAQQAGSMGDLVAPPPAAPPTRAPMGAGSATAAPAPSAPPPTAPVPVPPDGVPPALARANPGRYTLEDGSVWLVTPAGVFQVR